MSSLVQSLTQSKKEVEDRILQSLQNVLIANLSYKKSEYEYSKAEFNLDNAENSNDINQFMQAEYLKNEMNKTKSQLKYAKSLLKNDINQLVSINMQINLLNT
jgi:hypothetical protein